MKHYVGIDVGGTRIKAGLVSPQHEIIHELVLSLTPTDKSEDAILARIVDAASQVRGNAEIGGVGLGIPGCVDIDRGVVVTSPNFPQWAEFPVAERLRELISEPVTVDNDANCVILGESLAGVAKESAHMVGLTLGTGVGGAIILNGKIWRGAHGMAGEFGHIMVDPDGPQCGCGARGCLEMYASLVGFRHLCRAQNVPGIDTEATDLPEQLARAAKAGSPMAIQHFNTSGTMLGRALGGLLNALNVEMVILAGGVSRTFEWMEDALWAELRQRCYAPVTESIAIKVGSLGDRAGIIGAAHQSRS
jgi:glucokinase